MARMTNVYNLLLFFDISNLNKSMIYCSDPYYFLNCIIKPQY